MKAYGGVHEYPRLDITWGYAGRCSIRESARDRLSSGDLASCRKVINAFEGRKICYSRSEWPVVRSKAWVCGRSLAEIMGSNPTGGMDV